MHPKCPPPWNTSSPKGTQIICGNKCHLVSCVIFCTVQVFFIHSCFLCCLPESLGTTQFQYFPAGCVSAFIPHVLHSICRSSSGRLVCRGHSLLHYIILQISLLHKDMIIGFWVIKNKKENHDVRQHDHYIKAFTAVSSFFLHICSFVHTCMNINVHVYIFLHFVCTCTCQFLYIQAVYLYMCIICKCLKIFVQIQRNDIPDTDKNRLSFFIQCWFCVH